MMAYPSSDDEVLHSIAGVQVIRHMYCAPDDYVFSVIINGVKVVDKSEDYDAVIALAAHIGKQAEVLPCTKTA